MSDIKYFDPRALGSIASGILLLQDFSQVHEAIEWIMGHPVWTHELPDISRRVAELLYEQFPGLPCGELENWQEAATHLLDKYGDSVAVKKGGEDRSADPIMTAVAALTKGNPA